MKNSKFAVVHYPQIQCRPYVIDIDNIKEAIRIKDILCNYDLFQYENKIKPDYANMSIIQCYDEEEKEWYDLDKYDIENMLEELELRAIK